MGANAIPADRLDKAFPPRIYHQATANEVKAGTNEEIVQRKELSFIQNVTTIGDGKVESHENRHETCHLSDDKIEEEELDCYE